jgi:hypothetical protein
MIEAVAGPLRDEIARVFAGLDVESARASYWRQHEFLMLERCLPAAVVSALVGEVDRVRPVMHRNYIPRHKKGGSVGFHTLAAQAPAVMTLYRHPAFLAFLARVTGEPVQPCPDHDPHACALYFYTEPGDHIGFHYDTSYYRGRRYTILVGLVDRSSSRLVCQLYNDVPGRAVTPLGAEEERVSLTLQYVTDPRMTRVKRFVSDMKDAIAYFGFRDVFGRRGTSAPASEA